MSNMAVCSWCQKGVDLKHPLTVKLTNDRKIHYRCFGEMIKIVAEGVEDYEDM